MNQIEIITQLILIVFILLIAILIYFKIHDFYGVYKKKIKKPMPLIKSNWNGHLSIFGISGSGKTHFTKQLMKKQIKQRNVVFFDGKGEDKTREEMKQIAKETGKIFKYVKIGTKNLKNQTRYNPFKNISHNTAIEMIMSIRDYSEEFYYEQDKLIYKYLLKSLKLHRIPLNFTNIVYYMDYSKITYLMNSYKPKNIKKWENELNVFTNRFNNKAIKKNIETSGTALFNLYEGVFKKIFFNEGETFNQQQNNVFWYIQLDTNNYPSESKKLASFLITNLRQSIQDDRFQNGALIIFDELQQYMPNNNDVGSIYSLSRSKNIQCMVISQTPSNLKNLNELGDSIFNQIIANTRHFIIYHQNIPEDIELISSIGGTRKTKKKTKQIDSNNLQEETGAGSLREVEEYIIHPNVIRNLKPYYAVYLNTETKKFYGLNPYVFKLAQ